MDFYADVKHVQRQERGLNVQLFSLIYLSPLEHSLLQVTWICGLNVKQVFSLPCFANGSLTKMNLKLVNLLSLEINVLPQDGSLMKSFLALFKKKLRDAELGCLR